MSILSCQFCGKVLQLNQKKYCSRACFYEASKRGKSYKCLYCGKEVIRISSLIKQSIFCSRECYDNSRRGKTKPRKGKELVCKICGKRYYVANNRLEKSRYCSRQCTRISLQTSIEAKCPICKGKFSYLPSKPKIYCNRQCTGIAKKEKRIKSVCPTCNKEFRYTPSANAIYCSVECHNISRRKRIDVICSVCQRVFKQQPSSHQVYCSRKCSSKANRYVLSSLEKKVQSILPMNIKFVGTYDYWITFENGTRKNPDFIVIKKNGDLPKKITKVIEVHGNHWHQDEWDNRGQDLIDKYKQVGIDCLVLWGSEIEKDFGQVMKRISDFLNVEIRQLRLF